MRKKNNMFFQHMRVGLMLETYSKTIIDMKGRFKRSTPVGPL